MMRRSFLLLTLALPLLGACIKPIRELRAFRDPDFLDASFRRVAVLVVNEDLQVRYDIEAQLAESLRQRGVDAVASHMVLIPTRAWGDENEQLRILAGNGFDAYLHLSVNTVEKRQSTVPGVTSTEIKKELNPKNKSDDRNESLFNETVTTVTEEGYTVQSVRTNYIIRLIGMAERKTAWMGLNWMSDNFTYSLPRFCEEIAEQLLRDTVLLAEAPAPAR